jgi:hypothetical protein
MQRKFSANPINAQTLVTDNKYFNNTDLYKDRCKECAMILLSTFPNVEDFIDFTTTALMWLSNRVSDKDVTNPNDFLNAHYDMVLLIRSVGVAWAQKEDSAYIAKALYHHFCNKDNIDRVESTDLLHSLGIITTALHAHEKNGLYVPDYRAKVVQYIHGLNSIATIMFLTDVEIEAVAQ